MTRLIFSLAALLALGSAVLQCQAARNWSDARDHLIAAQELRREADDELRQITYRCRYGYEPHGYKPSGR